MAILQNLIKGITGNKAEFKEKYKQAEQEMKINKLLHERSLSSNERELNAYHNSKREEQIKQALDKIHKEQTKESWKPKHSILHSPHNILKNKETPKAKHIFLGKGTILTGCKHG